MATAARQAEAAGFSMRPGAPQKAMTASPMNLSMVPPSRSMQAERSERW
jgi:hypothetical protein